MKALFPCHGLASLDYDPCRTYTEFDSAALQRFFIKLYRILHNISYCDFETFVEVLAFLT